MVTWPHGTGHFEFYLKCACSDVEDQFTSYIPWLLPEVPDYGEYYLEVKLIIL